MSSCVKLLPSSRRTASDVDVTGTEGRDLHAHAWIANVRAALDSREPVRAAVDGTRRAAVAVILRAGSDGAPEVFFIKRADYAGDPWSGQVAFPGGRHEPADATLADTAIRETLEETGIDLARDGTMLGVLDDLNPVINRLPAIVVTPFVVLLNHAVPLTLSSEVALAFWVPLDALCRGGSWRETDVLARGVHLNARAFDHEGHIIWGMTERMLAQLISLLPKS